MAINNSYWKWHASSFHSQVLTRCVPETPWIRALDPSKDSTGQVRSVLAVFIDGCGQRRESNTGKPSKMTDSPGKWEMQGAFTPVLVSVWIGWLVGKLNQIAATQKFTVHVHKSSHSSHHSLASWNMYGHHTKFPSGCAPPYDSKPVHDELPSLPKCKHLSSSHNSQCIWLRQLL